MENTTIKRQETEDSLSRREALAKASKYAVFTAAAMMTILSPKVVVAADSLENNPTKPTSTSVPTNRKQQNTVETESE